MDRGRHTRQARDAGPDASQSAAPARQAQIIPSTAAVVTCARAARAGTPRARATCGRAPYLDTIAAPSQHLTAARDATPDALQGGRALTEHYGRARALVFSSVWEEPFGLTMVEALAHGTPVIALRRGSAPEVIIDGVTGILCDDFDEMAERLPEVMQLDPEACREDALTKGFQRLHR